MATTNTDPAGAEFSLPVAQTGLLTPITRPQTTSLVARVSVEAPHRARIWSPNRQRMRRAAVIWGLAFAISASGVAAQISAGFWSWLLDHSQVWLIPILNATWGGAFWVSVIIPVVFVGSMASSSKATQIMTDGTGIALITSGGRQIFRWKDLAGYEDFPLLRLMVLRANSGEHIRINTGDLSREEREELRVYIKRKVDVA